MAHREGTDEPGGADEIAAARDALDGRHQPLDAARRTVTAELQVIADDTSQA